MSNDPHRWMHFYQLGSAAESNLSQSASASTSTSLSSSPPATHANPSAGGSGASASLNPEGGVTKPARRRTRASRRTPTTIMNTDTTNFRAMVQQFTGGPPSTTFGSGPCPSMLSFGFDRGQGPASGLGQVEYSHQQQYQHQQYNNLLSLNTNTTTNNYNNTYHSNHGGEGDSRLHLSLEGIGSHTRGSGSMTAVEGGHHHGVPQKRRTSSSDDNRGNNNNNNSDYIF